MITITDNYLIKDKQLARTISHMCGQPYLSYFEDTGKVYSFKRTKEFSDAIVQLAKMNKKL